jgi:hypothetical protein
MDMNGQLVPPAHSVHICIVPLYIDSDIHAHACQHNNTDGVVMLSVLVLVSLELTNGAIIDLQGTIHDR